MFKMRLRCVPQHDVLFSQRDCTPRHRGCVRIKFSQVQELSLPRLVYCCTLMLIDADRTCRSGLELVSALCHHRPNAHRGVVNSYASPCKHSRKEVSTCDDRSPHTSYTTYTFQPVPAIRRTTMSEASSERKELKANWKTEVEVPLVSLEDVKKHNTKNDLWMVIHGGGEQAPSDLQIIAILTENQVYNVTEYARDHPGGPDALMEVAGTDATSAYEDVNITDSLTRSSY